VNELAPVEPGHVLFVSRSDVERLLRPPDCFDRCWETFRWVGEGLVDQVSPVNLFLSPEDPAPLGSGVVQAFPAFVRPLQRAGVKWLTSLRSNAQLGLPVISAVNIISDSQTGMPLAIIDGTSVTNLRTGGHAAVGARLLAREGSSVIAIIGCGQEGRTHLDALQSLFPVREIRAFDIKQDQVEGFRRFAQDRTSATVVVAESVRSAVDGADIVCVVTTAREPVLQEGWVNPGTHVCAATGFMDVDKACARQFDKWVVGWYGRDLDWIEGSEVGRLGGLEKGDLGKQAIYADIATELLLGTKPGRQDPGERTIMTHLGMPALDVAVSSLVFDLARSAGMGTLMRLF
jgi:ornithine cyclodeaminase/alanine dehydrogenase-like protein (mu-crystallin family)